jgi:hypothetical protein
MNTRSIVDVMAENKKKLDRNISWLHSEDSRFFSGDSGAQARRSHARDVALSIVEQGAKVRTLLTVLEEEVRLRTDTRNSARQGPPNETRLVLTSTGVVSGSSTERDLVRHDDKLIAARQQVLSAIDVYNGRVREFSNLSFRWGSDYPDFLELA